jgi:two-component system chemotaxis response regulator CheY
MLSGLLNTTNARLISKLVILIADSKPYSRALLRSMLLQLEIKAIHEATDGAAALDALSQINPDAMIVDWNLAVLDVPEVLRMIRMPGMVPNPDLPVLVVSSSGQSEYVHNAIKSGAQQFMVRPISPKMLEQRLVSIVKDVRKLRSTRPDSGSRWNPDSPDNALLAGLGVLDVQRRHLARQHEIAVVEHKRARHAVLEQLEGDGIDWRLLAGQVARGVIEIADRHRPARHA